MDLHTNKETYDNDQLTEKNKNDKKQTQSTPTPTNGQEKHNGSNQINNKEKTATQQRTTHQQNSQQKIETKKQYNNQNQQQNQQINQNSASLNFPSGSTLNVDATASQGHLSGDILQQLRIPTCREQTLEEFIQKTEEQIQNNNKYIHKETTHNNTTSINTSSPAQHTTHPSNSNSPYNQPGEARNEETSTHKENHYDLFDKIIQWNVNSFWTRYEDLRVLIKDMDPTILCLQETNLKKNEQPNLKGYKGFLNSKNKRVHGVALFVKEELHSKEIDIVTPLNAVACRVGLSKETTVCSIYLPPSEPTTTLERDLNDLLSQLPQPVILTGDLNAHNFVWGARSENDRGRIIEDFSNNNNLIILNTDEPTYYSCAYRSTSALDLTLVSPELATDTDWYVTGDLRGSDHYPTAILIPRIS
jgi:Endonuclease-reverse transcriptase